MDSGTVYASLHLCGLNDWRLGMTLVGLEDDFVVEHASAEDIAILQRKLGSNETMHRSDGKTLDYITMKVQVHPGWSIAHSRDGMTSHDPIAEVGIRIPMSLSIPKTDARLDSITVKAPSAASSRGDTRLWQTRRIGRLLDLRLESPPDDPCSQLVWSVKDSSSASTQSRPVYRLFLLKMYNAQSALS